MPFIEAPSNFYLGRYYNAEADPPHITDEIVYYESRDLTTHAVVVGMTGSGKTGLCITLLEEAILDKIPAIIIDPKGDIVNLLLTFPDLAPQSFLPWINTSDAARMGLNPEQRAQDLAQDWREGLASWGIGSHRIAGLKNSALFNIYTPGSDAGLPISILATMRAPREGWAGHEEYHREHIRALTTAILALIGISANPVKDREHILISNIFEYNWRYGVDLTMQDIILQVQRPPFERLGAFDIETFFPEKDRFKLALELNNIIAAPSFQSWLQGEPLDFQNMLYAQSPQGPIPRVNIFYIAHLGEAERSFMITLILESMMAGMRRMGGTSSLRMLLYFDEVFGHLPPYPKNPPSKEPLMKLIKQGRAFGIGTVLATQNPGDLDYKGLTNAGTWFIGRLQTENDKKRVLDGLTTASSSGNQLDIPTLDRLISSVDPRVFVMHNVHDPRGPRLIHSRWAMSYLGGPLTRLQIRQLMTIQYQHNMALIQGRAPIYQSQPNMANTGGYTPVQPAYSPPLPPPLPPQGAMPQQSNFPPPSLPGYTPPPAPYATPPGVITPPPSLPELPGAGQYGTPPPPTLPETGGYSPYQAPPAPYGTNNPPPLPSTQYQPPPPPFQGTSPSFYQPPAPPLQQSAPSPFGADTGGVYTPPPVYQPAGPAPWEQQNPPPAPSPFGSTGNFPPNQQPTGASVPSVAATNQEVRPTENLPKGYTSKQPAISSTISQYFLPQLLTLSQAINRWEGRNRQRASNVGNDLFLYTPFLLAQVQVRYLDRATGINTVRTYAYHLYNLDRAGLVHWDQYLTYAVQPTQLSTDPQVPSAAFGEPSAGLTDRTRLAALKKEVTDYVFKTAGLNLVFNPTLKIYHLPGMTAQEYQNQIISVAREGRDREVAAVTAKYEREFDKLESKYRNEERELNSDRQEVQNLGRENLFTMGEAAISLLQGRTAYTLSRVSRTRRYQQQAQSDVSESYEVLKEIERQMDELQRRFERELQEVNSKWNRIANERQETRITPYKKDIHLELFGIGWLPEYYVMLNGQQMRLPAWEGQNQEVARVEAGNYNRGPSHAQQPPVLPPSNYNAGQDYGSYDDRRDERNFDDGHYYPQY